ncbi:MAG: flagellar hook capping FlgD N-terminal domain-containing protein [Verrucomicrobiota bacterium]
MSEVSTVFSATSPQEINTDSGLAPQNLDSSEFLELLTVQLTNQDPLEPMKDTEFLAQMAQFTSLEQMQTLVDGFTQLNDLQNLTTAQSYLGRTVTILDNGISTEGVVESVSQGQTEVVLTVNGTEYPMSSVSRVSLDQG